LPPEASFFFKKFVLGVEKKTDENRFFIARRGKKIMSGIPVSQKYYILYHILYYNLFFIWKYDCTRTGVTPKSQIFDFLTILVPDTGVSGTASYIAYRRPPFCDIPNAVYDPPA
jgi:hypothetical protein